MSTITPPEPNEERFRILYSGLVAILAPVRTDNRSTNYSAVARILGISVRKAKDMDTTFDPWAWWPIVLIAAIRDVLPYIDHTKRSRAINILSDLPEEILLPIENSVRGADYLRAALRKGPLPAKRLLAAGMRGDVSRDSVYRAAQRIGVVKEWRFFGKKKNEKKMVWRLPTEDEV